MKPKAKDRRRLVLKLYTQIEPNPHAFEIDYRSGVLQEHMQKHGAMAADALEDLVKILNLAIQFGRDQGGPKT